MVNGTKINTGALKEVDCSPIKTEKNGTEKLSIIIQFALIREINKSLVSFKIIFPPCFLILLSNNITMQPSKQ